MLALAATAALALAACGGDEGSATSTVPLTLEQRVVTEEDAPDSKADPVETPESVSSADEFISRFGDRFINPPPEDVEELKSGSFVRALHVTLDKAGAEQIKKDWIALGVEMPLVILESPYRSLVEPVID